MPTSIIAMNGFYAFRALVTLLEKVKGLTQKKFASTFERIKGSLGLPCAENPRDDDADDDDDCDEDGLCSCSFAFDLHTSNYCLIFGSDFLEFKAEINIKKCYMVA